MTIDDAFDARLKAAFSSAEPDADPAFVQRVEEQLRRAERRRLLVVGAAALVGAIVASTQVGALLERLSQLGTTMPDIADVAADIPYIQPETLVVAAVAAVAACLAVMLPSRT